MVTTVFVRQCGNGGSAVKAGNHASQKGAGGSGSGGGGISAATAAERAENTGAVKLIRAYDRRLNQNSFAIAERQAKSIASRQSKVQLQQTVARVTGRTPRGKSKAALTQELSKGIRARIRTNTDKVEDRVLNNPRANYIMGARSGSMNNVVLGRGGTGRNRRRVFIGA